MGYLTGKPNVYVRDDELAIILTWQDCGKWAANLHRRNPGQSAWRTTATCFYASTEQDALASFSYAGHFERRYDD